MAEHELEKFQNRVIEAIKNETHDAIKHTGKTWVKEAVEETVPVAVEATFVKLGIDCKNPFEAQRDFAYLRTAREESEDRRKIIVGAITRWGIGIFIAAASAGASLWSAMQNKP